MPTYGWIIVIAILLIVVYYWMKYGGILTTINNNPSAVHAGLSVNRYLTDVQGLVGAFQSAENNDGPFMSRLGAFFGALPS